jgi:hypothetical protein
VAGTEAPLNSCAAPVAGLSAGLVMEVPTYLQRALPRPLRQDVFAEGGLLRGVRGTVQRCCPGLSPALDIAAAP